MSALFQSVATQLGNLGGSYATARDAQTQAKNDLAKTQFDQSLRLKQFLEEQQMDALQKRIADANLTRQQAGNWDVIGNPMQMKGGGYGVVERNTVTGDVRTRPLPPDVEPQNEDEIKWQQYSDAYQKAFKVAPPDAAKQAFFNKLAGGAPKLDEFDAWREAFKAQNGRDPNAAEISEFHRAPKAATGVADDQLDATAEAVSARQTKLPAGKLGVQVLNRMRQLGLQLPTQLNPATEDKLATTADALNMAIDTIDRIKPQLPLLKSLPAAALVDLAQHSDTAAQVLTRMFPGKSQQVEQLAGDLRTLQEQVNIVRQPLGATGFRGKEGWEALQMQTIKALGNPNINAVTLNNTETTMKALLNSTLQTLGEAPGENSASPPPSPSSPPPGAPVISLDDFLKGK